MKSRSLKHLSDQALKRGLDANITQDRTTTVDLLAHIAEFDSRKLYLPAGYPSMYSYCIHELRMSEDIALKRLRAARAARKFPTIFDALEDGRLHLSGVALLARHLTQANASELLSAAVHKTKAGIELLLAQRFPHCDVPTEVRPLVPVVAAVAPASGLLGEPALLSALGPANISPAPGPVTFLTPQHGATPTDSCTALAAPASPPAAHTRVAPLAPGRFALQATVDQATHDQLRYAQALLGHAVPSGDVSAVLKRALDALVDKLERQKFAKCARSRQSTGSPKGRYVPAEVRRTVWQRDDGRCTFASDGGKRCGARERLEFDHAEPVAQGGQATASNLRLRCRAHNQYTAECAFGSGFMHEKRQDARGKTAPAKTGASSATEPTNNRAVVPWLHPHGFSPDDARRGVARCLEAIGDQGRHCESREAPHASGLAFAATLAGPPGASIPGCTTPPETTTRRPSSMSQSR